MVSETVGRSCLLQEGHAEYPESVRHLFNMAGVLDAVPYDGTPVIKDGMESPLMPELSRYQWSKEGGCFPVSPAHAAVLLIAIA